MTATTNVSSNTELADIRLALRQTKCMDEPLSVEQLLAATGCCNRRY